MPCGNFKANRESSSISSSRKFVATFAVTLAVAVSAALASSEILLRRHVVPNDSFEVAREAFRTGGTPFAIFGDSRVESGIRGSAQLANFGTRSDALETVLGKAEAWLARNPDGQVIIALPPQQFSSQRLGADQSALLADFISQDDATLQILRQNHRRYLLEYVNVVMTDPEILWRPPAAQTSASAPPPSFADKPQSVQKAEAERRIQHHTPIQGFVESSHVQTLRTRLQALRDGGAGVCLITMPVSRAYRTAASVEPAFAESRALFDRIAREVAVPYIDLWDDYPDTLFRDPDHLHPEGTAIVTRNTLARCQNKTGAQS